MRMARWLTLFALLISASSAAAQEYLYDDGVFVGLGAQASFYSRDRTIHYGFPAFCPPPEFCTQRTAFSGTKLDDVAASPSLLVGYKFNDNDAISLKGDWARYSVSRGLVGSDATGFTTISVNGARGVFVPPGAGDNNININWESDVFNTALEYQRRLTRGELGGISGLLGFSFRYEKQDFDAKAKNVFQGSTLVLDSYHENLREFLFGPYAGLKLAFKPDKPSRWNFSVAGHAGWYFKSAFFHGHNSFVFEGESFSQDDHSKQGTLYAGATADIVFSISRNWFLDASYNFNWIQSAAHIWNTNRTTANASQVGAPSRIVGSSIITHTPGVKLIYKFD